MLCKPCARRAPSVIGAGRDLDLGQRLLPGIEWRHADFNRLLTVADWRPVLAGLDAIVNTVGILQSTAKDDAHRIQVTATSALFEAAAAAGIRRVVHISAISAEPEVADRLCADPGRGRGPPARFRSRLGHRQAVARHRRGQLWRHLAAARRRGPAAGDARARRRSRALPANRHAGFGRGDRAVGAFDGAVPRNPLRRRARRNRCRRIGTRLSPLVRLPRAARRESAARAHAARALGRRSRRPSRQPLRAAHRLA